MKKLPLLVLMLLTLAITTACDDKYPDLEEGVYAEFVTTKGTFVAKLYHEATPLTTASFVSLAEGTNEMVDSLYKGKPFYNGLTFHRVIKDFMIQGGDPSGDGTGSPGYRFPDEIVDTLKHDSKGILSMANSGPETNGSQFFITLKETPWLDGKHTVFGEIVIGQDIVDAIGNVETTKPGDKPVEPIHMNEVNIIRKGKVSVVDFAKRLKEIEKEREAIAERIERIAIDKAVEFVNMKNEATATETGLQIYYNQKGEGAKPAEGEKVLVDYSGYFTNGQLFTTSKQDLADEYGQIDPARQAADMYQPITTTSTDTRLIPGFREALKIMRVGDKVTVFIPSHLGYGEQGNRPYIPPNTDLVFEIEMLDMTAEE